MANTVDTDMTWLNEVPLLLRMKLPWLVVILFWFHKAHTTTLHYFLSTLYVFFLIIIIFCRFNVKPNLICHETKTMCPQGSCVGEPYQVLFMWLIGYSLPKISQETSVQVGGRSSQLCFLDDTHPPLNTTLPGLLPFFEHNI